MKRRKFKVAIGMYTVVTEETIMVSAGSTGAEESRRAKGKWIAAKAVAARK